MRPARRLTVTSLAATLLVLVGDAAMWRADAATSGTLTATVTGALGTVVSGPDQLTVDGDTPVSVGVARVSDGNATVVAGPDSTLPRAIQFPPYVASGTYPRAVVSLTPTSGLGLSPGAADFSFGAVLRLDASSSGRSVDNGDNAFQRGLSSEASLFKLELDKGRPACTVRGSSGTVIARSASTISRRAWYTVTCARVGSKVTVTATPHVTAGASAAAVASTSTSGSIGNVTFAATRPASVGGKLTASGAVATSASDQFNGAIAQVWTRRS